MDLLSFFTGGTLLAAAAVAVIRWIIEKTTKTKSETLGSVIILGIISFLLAGASYGWNYLSPAAQAAAGQIFASAIVLYDVFWKAIFEGGGKAAGRIGKVIGRTRMGGAIRNFWSA